MGTTQCCQTAKADQLSSDSSVIQAQKACESNNVTAASSPKSIMKSAEKDNDVEGKPSGSKQNVMKEKVMEHMNNVKQFRTFIQASFKSPGEAWTFVTKNNWNSSRLQKAEFVKKMEELGFDGNAEKNFHCH